MYCSGITDEAGSSIDTQIKVIKELGWKHMELRKVQVGDRPVAMVHDLSDDDFNRVVDKVQEADLEVSCFASAIANGAKQIADPFDASRKEAERCIPRMKKIGASFVRIMSFSLLSDAKDHPLPPDQQMKEERFRRVRELHKMFTDEGLTPVHENCWNYGGMGWRQTLELLEEVPGMKLVFDTGNPVFTDDCSKAEPRPKQSAWEFYKNVREHVIYVHIKDGVWNREAATCEFCFPGEGKGDVVRILQDLKDRNYTGGLSMEPHMKSVFHEDALSKDVGAGAYQTFLEYGRRFEKILSSLKS